MSKKTFLMSFAVLALLATASMVMAQPGGGQGGRGQGGRGQGPGGPGGPGGGPGMMMGGMGPGGGAMGILMNEEARTALGITEEQAQKLRDAGESMRGNFQPPQRGQQGPPDAAQMAQFRERMQKMQEESRKSVESILSADQVTKLDVMVFQRSGGLDGMANVESLRALNLTEDQKKKVQEAQEKIMTTMRPTEGFDFRNASQEERQAFMEKMRAAGEKAREEFQSALKGILTDDQKAKAEKLMKDVPEYLQRRGGPGQGGPGGPGGRQGGNLDNWQPGQGGGQNPNPNREQRPQRGNAGGRQFPG